jgi:hypothetical protein
MNGTFEESVSSAGRLPGLKPNAMTTRGTNVLYMTESSLEEKARYAPKVMIPQSVCTFKSGVDF